MKVDRNSYGTVALVYLFCAAVVAALFLLGASLWVSIPVTILMIAIAVWQTLFHMVPVRTRPHGASLVSAVADGKVIIVDKAYEPEYFKSEAIKVSVYMDFWDFHANFWPVTGTVTYAKYYPGKHLLAFKPKASDENEHFCTVVQTPKGREVFFKQIAGGFARRIVCYASDGMDVNAGQQCGIIKFGSRLDYYLPMDAEVKVKCGDLVRACETVIATL